MNNKWEFRYYMSRIKYINYLDSLIFKTFNGWDRKCLEIFGKFDLIFN